MRLSEHEITVIKKSIHHLDPEAQIYLFGSRTDMTKKGGDIDLLVLSQKLTRKDKLAIKYSIFQELEEQKIDIVISHDTNDPFVRIALKTGKQL